MRKWHYFWLFLLVVMLAGCADKKSVIDKVNNRCTVDSDCAYIGYTGGCNTPEYVADIMKKCQEKIGPCPSEAQIREGITCTCENNICITNS